LYNMGEPFINKDLPKMIKYAKEKQFSERISFVTNAILMNKENAVAIAEANPDRVIISLYGLTDEDYVNHTRKQISFNQVYENIKYFNSIKKDSKIYVKVIDRATPTPEKRHQFIDMFKDHCDFYSIESLGPIWPNFNPEEDKDAAKDLNDAKRSLYEGVEIKDHVTCHYPFFGMLISPTGKVNPCVVDWNEFVTLGDATTKSLNEIWNSKEYQDFRLLHLIGKRKTSNLCATCGNLKLTTLPEDNLDDVRLDLLHKLFPEYKGEVNNSID